MDNKKEKKEVYEISIKEVFNTLKKGMWFILACAIVFGSVAFILSSMVLPKSYTSRVKLYVKTYSNGDITKLSDFNYASSKVNTYIQMLDTNNFREKLSDNLDNKYTAVQLNKMVSFSRPEDENTEVFSATINASSPTESKIIADSVADVAPGIMSGLNDDTELKIVDSATIPTKPSSPSVTKNTIVAFAAGFVLALILVLIREALDNKVKYNSDELDILGVPILSAIPDFNGERIILGNMNVTENSKESEAV